MQLRTALLPIMVLLWGMLTAGGALAEGNIQLKSLAEVEQTHINPDGKMISRRVPAVKVLHGQEVIYTTTYKNISDEVAENATITNPIPDAMRYKAFSATGAGTGITFSVDGGKTYNTPAKLFIKDAAGREFPARPRDYTHIRWTFEKPLPSGATGEVSFRAVLR